MKQLKGSKYKISGINYNRISKKELLKNNNEKVY